MAGVQLRNVGTTSVFAPIIKRGVVTLTDGRTVSMFIDNNTSGASGTDATGVAKIHLYVSTDVSRTAFTLATSYTPAVAPCSTTRYAVASMTAGADNSIWVAWQGVDNALYVTRWSYSAGTVTFVATETVQASGAITNRFRAIDIDLTGNATAVVATYEARTAGGDGSFHRVYARSNAATWVRAVTLTALAVGQPIKTSGEDISVGIRGDGVVSNVIRFLVYATKTQTTIDLGDLLTEYSYNVSTAAADGGVLLGTWSSAFNKNQAAGTRRGMIFTLSSTVYLLAGVIGAGVPKFISAKLSTGVYTAPVISTAGFVSTVSLSNFFKIDTSANLGTYVSFSYKDNRLLFGFAGLGTGASPRMFREVSMSWANVGTIAAKPTIDSIPRPLDSATYNDGGPIGIYGGDNKRTQASLKYYNFLAWYGRLSDTITATAWFRTLRFVSEDTFDAPILVSPYYIEPTSRPTYRVRVENVNLQPNLYGKIEVQIASDTLFTTSVKTITQDDASLQYFGSQDGLTGGMKQVAIPTQNASQALTQGTWYWRARIVSDKDTPGAYSGYLTFTVSHPPGATPVYPAPAAVIADVASNAYQFSWIRSDTEPNDSQTQYRVIVRRRDTFANVVDTGFVVSSAAAVTLSIDANALGILEIPLDWTVQLKDADGVTGPASQPVQFQIGDPPNLDITSPDGISVVTTALPTIAWTFTGFGTRTQQAYRIFMFDNTTPNILSNPSFESGTTGWGSLDTTSAVQSATQARRGGFSMFITPTGSGPTPRIVSAAGNRAVVNPGDQLTVEAYIRPTTANKPIIAGVSWYDSGGTFISTTSVTAAAIALTWQYITTTATAPVGAAFGAAMVGLNGTPAAGDTAYIDQVQLHLPSAAASNTVADTLWLASSATSYTFNTQVLVDAHQYGVTVEVKDTGGLVTESTEYFTTDWTEPALASGRTVTTPDAFKVRVTWTDAAQDADWVSYRVYRRYMTTSISQLDVYDSATTWYLVYETEAVSANYTFDDYLAPLNIPCDYVVVQLADRFGSLIESVIGSFSTVTLVGDRYYFVPEVLIGGIASFEASSVTGDNFSRDVEQETLHVIGRGRQMQVGDDLGYSGTMSIKQRNPTTARRDREMLETISALYNKVFIKSPFGDVVLCGLGNIQSTRIAGYGGHSDFVDITVPYTQIIGEDPIPRPGA